jgi:uncharacterized protein YcbK (DUF882 family)
MMRLIFAALMAIAVVTLPTIVPVNADVGDRTLYLYHTHTHETARITFKRNGVYDAQGLQQLDWFLRDWRNNQPTTMSPQLFDLIWEIYQKSGATQPINIVSAYRSPVTNAYLHSRSSAVANNSQHMLGHAMDIFIPGVPLARLREVAMQQQVGGVGFYPTSGSPFVHVDVGPVRAWPRMTEAQLRATFPSGATLHLPTDGVVLSSTGYAFAQQQWNQCHAVPCTNLAALRGGASSMGKANMMEVAETSMTGKTFSDIHAGVNPGNPRITNPGGYDASSDDTADSEESAGPEQTAVETVAIAAPIPMAPRPADLLPPSNDASVDDQNVTLAEASAVPFDSLFPDAYAPTAVLDAHPGDIPMPAQKSYGMMVATGEHSQGQDAIAAIASASPLPATRSHTLAAATDMAVSAYAPIGAGTPAESQLEALIRNETTGTIAMAPAGGTALTNSVGSPIGADALRNYAASRRTHQGMPPRLALASASFSTRRTHLVPPGFTADLVQPVAMSSDSFAKFVQPSANDLSPATELGPMVMRTSFHPSEAAAPVLAGFDPASSLLVAYR